VSAIRYKGVPNNPYRVHPQIKLTAIPTIIKWTKVVFVIAALGTKKAFYSLHFTSYPSHTQAGPGDRLVENDCRSEEAVARFLSA